MDQLNEASSSKGEFLPGYATLDTYSQDFLRTMATAIKDSNALPSERKEDWDYYSTFKSFRQVAQAQQEAIEKKISAILKYNGVKGRVGSNDVSGMLELLADSNDQILERVGTYLDEANGVRKKTNPLLIEVSQVGGRISGSWNKKPDAISDGSKNQDKATESVRLLAAKNVARPQVNFKDKIDNSLNPFMPRLTEKPHSLKPLSILIEYDNDGNECYSHPYAFEIENFRILDWQLEPRPAKRPKFAAKLLSETPLEMVETVGQLKSMIEELSKESVIGVDLEAHSYRTYLGITCLIQISTESKDYLIDPFPLWNDMFLLNEVFANPKVLKVLHGAIGDIGWLQRDFSVYVVNMFDTHIAAKILEFPRGCLSLAYLLHHYSKISTEKRFQLADWRIRPLISEMIDYARTDTHYLMDIYHCMKDELLEKGNEHKNLINAVYSQSNALCKTVFSKPRISHLPLLQRCKVNFNSRQNYAFKELYNWRNKLARIEDESEAYVLPTHMLIKISTELPREMQGILACCNPIPPLVKQYLQEVHQIILKARELPVTMIPTDSSTTSEETGTTIETGTSVGILDIVEDPLKCPLDVAHLADLAQSDSFLKVLLDKDRKIEPKKVSILEKPSPSIDLFEIKPDLEKTIVLKPFLTPFQRFQMLRPYLKAINEDADSSSKNDEERIKSIKEHFDALTAMTPADFIGEKKDENKDPVAETAEDKESENEMEESISKFEPEQPFAIGKLREQRTKKPGSQVFQGQRPVKRSGEISNKLFQDSHKKKKKKISNNPVEVQTEAADVDFTNVDYSQYSGGAKKTVPNANEFNPWKNYDKKGKNSKQKQRYKPAGKSVTYKK